MQCFCQWVVVVFIVTDYVNSLKAVHEKESFARVMLVHVVSAAMFACLYGAGGMSHLW